MSTITKLSTAMALALVSVCASSALAQPGCPGAGTVYKERRITQYASGFTGPLDAGDLFGAEVTAIGDVNGDGVADLAVGASYDDDGGTNAGAVWILFLNASGMVEGHQKISATTGNFAGPLEGFDNFGIAIASLGDFDLDGVPDIAVGASLDDDGGADRGAIWILLLNANGTVKESAKISATSGNFAGLLDNGDNFGFALATPGDLDGNGVVDLIATAVTDDDGGIDRGAAWVLFLNANATVKTHQKISDTTGNFNGVLDNADWFGTSISVIGDLDGNGVTEVGIGAHLDDDGGLDRGAAWILFLNANGTVKAHQKISATSGNLGSVLDNEDWFGEGVTGIGDIDGDGTPDIVVGAARDDDGGPDRGAARVLFLHANGTVKAQQKISQSAGGFGDVIGNGACFARAGAALGDLDGDGRLEYAVGAHSYFLQGNPGDIWVVSLNGCSIAPAITQQPLGIIVDPLEPAAFYIAAAGSPTLAYQWRRDGMNLVDGGHIAGALSPMLILKPSSFPDEGNYDCVVSNGFGSKTSNAAVLSVRAGCYADCDLSGDLNIDDFICFQTLFAIGC